MKKFTAFLISLLLVSFIFSSIISAQTSLPDAGLLPDSSFYFLKSWKESIQLFFTFNAENKVKQYLHLAEVRLAEYQKMIEKGKTDIAEKTLSKYENQLNRALLKAEEIKQKGKDIKDLSQQIETATFKHLDLVKENREKVPETARKGIETAIENSQKGIESFGSENKQRKERDKGENIGVSNSFIIDLFQEIKNNLTPDIFTSENRNFYYRDARGGFSEFKILNGSCLICDSKSNNKCSNDIVKIKNFFGNKKNFSIIDGGDASFKDYITWKKDNIICNQESDSSWMNLCCGEIESNESLINNDEISISGDRAVDMSKDESSNWKTYRNEKYGFEFKYPNRKELVGDLNLDAAKKIWVDPPKEFGMMMEKGISLSVMENINIDEYIINMTTREMPSSNSSSSFVNVGSRNIRYINSIKWENVFYLSPIGYNSTYITEEYIITQNNNLIIIRNNDNSEESKDVVNQILSTFKFINQ